MGRNILFITTDQQRYDSLGCNGGKIAQTPVADRLAAAGINYHRAHNQNVVCMPARSTMITGQYVRTHGVVANGVALPPDAPSIAGYLHEKAGYRTALLGKAHFEPALDMRGRWFENRMAAEDSTGPYRGFERMELAMHGPLGRWHYSLWLLKNHPEAIGGFSQVLSAAPGGDTGAPEVKYNPIRARELSHRLGRRSHHRVSRFARSRRELARMDELSRPASSVGSARKGGAPHQLARSRSARRLPRLARQDRADPPPEAAPLDGMVRRPLRQFRGRSEHLCARHAHRRSDSRGQRDWSTSKTS